MENGISPRKINRIDFLEMNNFNSFLLDNDLYPVFDFDMSYNKNIKIFRIVERDTRYTVGAVEFFLTSQGLDIKIGLNEAYRNCGNGTEILKRILNSFGETLNNTEYFIAHIAPDNKASQRAFSKCGFNSDFDSLELELDEGYLTYKKKNPNYGKKSHCSDATIFYDVDEENTYYKLEVLKSDENGCLLDKPVITRVVFRRVYDGMEIITEYQDNIEDLVKTIWYIESRFEVVYPDSMYFTYALRVSKGANKSRYVELFNKYNFYLDEYSSTDECLIFKRLNKHYVEDLNEILKRARYKGEKK